MWVSANAYDRFDVPSGKWENRRIMDRQNVIVSAVYISAVCIFVTLTSTIQAQQPNTSGQAGVATTMSNKPITDRPLGGASIAVSVVNDKKKPLDRTAVANLFDANAKAVGGQQIEENSGATFSGLALGKYDIQVSAIGYLTARKEVTVTNQLQPLEVKVVLMQDPDAVELEPIDPSLPPKASKEAKHGISDLKSGKFKDAQKHFESASNQAPSSAYPNFLLGSLFFQENDVDRAQTYLVKATTLDPRDVQALNLLGRLHLVKKDYAGAKTTLDQAIAADPENATSHSLLAEAYLSQGDYRNALAQAEIAAAKDKTGTSGVHLVQGQALAHLGRTEEAIQTLKMYLQTVPDSASAPQVRQLIAMLEQNKAGASAQPAKP
jgi:tetratricopeptide (TPR) repeat protein